MVLFLHTFLRGHLRRSLQSGLFRTNTMAAATHIPFIHPTEDGGPDERTNGDIRVSTLLLLPCPSSGCGA